MAEQPQQLPAGQQKKIPVEFPSQLKGGAYANNTRVMHAKEEFILDFLMVGPDVGAVTSRVIMSPGHMKRMIAALQENMRKYEQKYGSLAPADEPKGHVGFLKD
jgi:hypothetical protein